MNDQWSLVLGRDLGWVELVLAGACLGIAGWDLIAGLRRPARLGRARWLVSGLRLAAVAFLFGTVMTGCAIPRISVESVGVAERLATSVGK